MRTNLIYITTNTSNEVVANSIIPLTTIQRKYGCATIPAMNGVILNKPGYYKLNASVTFTAPEAGDVEIVAQKSGVDLVGMSATTTITTASTEVRTLNINGIIRINCNDVLSTINLVNVTSDITVQNVSLDIEYLD